jgi:hypothetical protein
MIATIARNAGRTVRIDAEPDRRTARAARTSSSRDPGRRI